MLRIRRRCSRADARPGRRGSVFSVVRRQLLLQRRELGKGRVRIDRPVALARIGARRVGPVRWSALVAATTLVAEIAPAAVTTELATLVVAIAALVIVVVAARTTILARRLSLAIAGGLLRALARWTLAEVLAEFLDPVATPAPGAAPLLALALLALAWRTGTGRGLLATGRRLLATIPLRPMMMPTAALMLVARTALLGAAAGPPDFDQGGLG